MSIALFPAVAYPILSPQLGSVGAPAYSWAQDPTSGFYLSGFGDLSYSDQGTQAIKITSAYTRVVDGSAAAPAYSFLNDPDSGMYGGASALYFAVDGVGYAGLFADEFDLKSTAFLGWSGSTIGQTADVKLLRRAAHVLSLEDGANANELRVYGTTTGPVYASVANDGTDTILSANGVAKVTIKTNGAARFSFGGSTGGLEAEGNFRFSHGTSALATAATEGFFFMNTCAGTPTGVPASIPSGQVPRIFDTTNLKEYIYTGGAWKKAQVAGVDVIWA